MLFVRLAAHVIHEDFIALVYVPSSTSATLIVKDILIESILPLNKCRGQAYVGASNMMGHI